MRKILIYALIALAVLGVVGVAAYSFWPKSPKLTLTPPTADRTATSGRSGVSVGWSVKDDPAEAVAEAVAMARSRLDDTRPKFAYAVYTVGYDPEKVIGEFRRQLESSIKIHGLTSSFGVMTNDGYHRGRVGALAVMLVGADDLDFGSGLVDLNVAKTPEEAGRNAVLQAIRDAGRSEKDLPDLVIMNGTPRRGDDMEVLDGIASVIGKTTLVIGGTAGNDTNDPTWRQFTRSATQVNGLLLTAVYTNRKVGWAFDSEFKTTDKGGIVTKSVGKTAYEIDGRPALDVYNEWLGGGLLDQIKTLPFVELMKITALNPLGRVLRGDAGQVDLYTLHPAPTPDNFKDRALPLAGAIPQGSEVKLLAATWQTIMNRAENIPRRALLKGAMSPTDALFGIVILCRGAANTLPETELAKIPALTDNVVEGTPFIGVISRGEQGLLEGIRNVNANLVESMLIFGR